MPHVIDSFLIEIGLDPKKLNQGQQQARSEFKKTLEDLKKMGNEAENHGQRTVQAFESIKRSILGVGALIGINAGFGALAKNITQADAATGRMAYTMNTSVERLGTWRQAVKLAGGTAEGFDKTITSISDDLQNFKITNESNVIPLLRSLGAAGNAVSLTDAKGNLRDVLDIVRDIGRAVNATTNDPAERATLLRKFGIDEGTIQILIRGEDAINKLMVAGAALNAQNDKNSKNAAELEKQWTKMSASAMKLASAILNFLSPALMDIMRVMGDLFERFSEKEFIRPDSLIGKIMSDPKKSIMQHIKEHDWGEGTRQKLKDDAAKQPGALPSTDVSAFGSQAEKEAFIRREAIRRRIDPEIAMRVARAEGFDNFLSAIPGEKSYGAFQLNISKNPNKPSLGDRFKAETGLDPSDPKTEKEGIKFSLDEVAKTGWGQWYGAKRVGIGNWDGIPRGGAAMAAEGPSGGAGRSGNSSVETNIGAVNVYTQATDANGIARDMRGALQNNSLATQAQTGAN